MRVVDRRPSDSKRQSQARAAAAAASSSASAQDGVYSPNAAGQRHGQGQPHQRPPRQAEPYSGGSVDYCRSADPGSGVDDEREDRLVVLSPSDTSLDFSVRSGNVEKEVRRRFFFFFPLRTSASFLRWTCNRSQLISRPNLARR